MFQTVHRTESKSKASTQHKGGQGVSFFQPKLTVNIPGDAHEQEADRVADQVMQKNNLPIMV